MRVSIVIPAFEAWRTLPTVLEVLRPQVRRPDREVIVVESSDESSAANLATGHPWLEVVSLPARALPGRARNIGVARAKGELLAFLDADAVPEAGWIDALELRLAPQVDAVAGAVLNGTPFHPVGTAGYLLEFAEWLPRRRGVPTHGATCNLLVRRRAFEEVGGFVEDVFPGEDTILTFGLARRGRLVFAPEARVRHLNRTAMAEFLRHQRRLGASFVSVCEHVDFPHAAFCRPLLAPLAVPFRLLALAQRVGRSPRQAAAAITVLPFLVAGLLAWSYGVIRR